MIRLTARWVLPITADPIEHGEVVVDSDKIVYCGPSRPSFECVSNVERIDLGDAILMPGLVNVHSHLEYTVLRGFLEDVDFFPWIRTLTALKTQLTPDDWLISARLGAAECVAAGITTIGDNADAPGSSARAISEIGLRARVYQEIFGIDPRIPVDETMAELNRKLDCLAEYASDRVAIGVSPHAPYTVRPELMRRLGNFCESNGLRTSIHVAESEAECNLIRTGEGPFAQMLARRGIDWIATGASPTRYLADLGAITSGTLCVHCVHQSAADIELLVEAGASVAHCPKSNAKLGSGIAPLIRWLDHPRLPLGLGTDSAVSNNTLDIFEEMRFGLLAQRADLQKVVLSARSMIEAATIGGARALGWDEHIGSLSAGKQADLIAVRIDELHTTPASDPYSALLYSARADDVCLTVAAGRILYRDGRFVAIDVPDLRGRAGEVRRRIVVPLST